MRRILLIMFYVAVAALMISFAAAAAHAQTISPLVQECGHKCRNEFSIKNNSLQPLTVTLHPFSVALEATGASRYRPLDADTDLRLEEMSARLGPQATHNFGYELRCKEVPCVVAIVAMMTVGKTPQGLSVRIALPEVVYLCEKSKDCRKSVRKAAGL